MKFNALINSLLGEELSDRQKRAAALRKAITPTIEIGGRVRVKPGVENRTFWTYLDLSNATGTIVDYSEVENTWTVKFDKDQGDVTLAVITGLGFDDLIPI